MADEDTTESNPDDAGGPNPAEESTDSGEQAAGERARRQRGEEEDEATTRRRRLREASEADLLRRMKEIEEQLGTPGTAKERARLNHERAHHLVAESAEWPGRWFGSHRRMNSRAWLQDGVIRYSTPGGKMDEKTVRDIAELALEIGWMGQELSFTKPDGRTGNPEHAVAFNQTLHGWRNKPKDVRFHLSDAFGLSSKRIRLTAPVLRKLHEEMGGRPLFSVSLDKPNQEYRSWSKFHKTHKERREDKKNNRELQRGERLANRFNGTSNRETIDLLRPSLDNLKARQALPGEYQEIREELQRRGEPQRDAERTAGPPPAAGAGGGPGQGPSA